MTKRRGEPARVLPRAAISKKFARLATKNTEPELLLRRALHARGLRYRVDFQVPGLPRRRMDIVFPKQRLVVLVDGCFWHGCPEHRKPPEKNAEWWQWKVETNRARDRDTDQRLEALGWKVLRIWEHETVEHAVLQVETARSALDAKQHLDAQAASVDHLEWD